MKDDSNSVDYEKLTVQEPVPGKTIINAPRPALTAASGGSLTSGGTNNLKTADANILANALQRIADLETALKKLGFIK